MNRLPVILSGALLAFAAAWLGLVFYPADRLGHLGPELSKQTGEPFPPPLSALAQEGQRVYAANGCVYCHSQQVRPAWLSNDIAKGYGPRQTVARDYIRERPVFLGTMRTGPDLTNVGVRWTDPAWHYQHLYEPSAITPGSIMPSFRFLFLTREIGEKYSSDAVLVRGPHAPPPGYEVVPSEEARALVAYLLSLKHDYPLTEAPDETAP